MTYLKGRIKSFKYALTGLKLLLKELNFQIHLVAFVLIIILSIYLKISSYEWLFVLLSSFFVLICEAINTAIEKIMDFTSLEKDKRIADIKDISAAFVLLSAINAVIVGAFIFVPKIIVLLA